MYCVDTNLLTDRIKASHLNRGVTTCRMSNEAEAAKSLSMLLQLGAIYHGITRLHLTALYTCRLYMATL